MRGLVGSFKIYIYIYVRGKERYYILNDFGDAVEKRSSR